MKRVNLLSIGCLSAVSLLLGCVSDDSQLVEGEEHQPGIVLNGIVLNRLGSNGIVLNGLAATQLAASPLATGRIGDALQAGSSSQAMLATAEGRTYLSYIVSCALPAGDVLKATYGGEALEFHGGAGLVPDWEHRALTMSEKRWMSACLLSRVNAYGISVSISMRGHQALTPTEDERQQYTAVEGAFWGNVFVEDPSKMEMFACRGAAQAAGEAGDLVNRDCTEPAQHGLTVCGMTYAGDCLDYTPAIPSLRSCSTSLDGNYTNCHRYPSLGIWPNGTGRSEVVTVFVRN